MRREVKKFCGSYTLEVAFEEDSQTLTTFEHVPGMVAVLCTLRKEGKVVGQGRGSSVASRMNRGIERTAYTAINGALLSAVNNATKILDTLRLDEADEDRDAQKVGLAEAYRARHNVGGDRATEKQKSYARQLLSLNVEDESDREQIASTLDEMTRVEISTLIKRLAR